jgi:hypothetical protein
LFGSLGDDISFAGDGTIDVSDNGNNANGDNGGFINAVKNLYQAATQSPGQGGGHYSPEGTPSTQTEETEGITIEQKQQNLNQMIATARTEYPDLSDTEIADNIEDNYSENPKYLEEHYSQWGFTPEELIRRLRGE